VIGRREEVEGSRQEAVNGKEGQRADLGHYILCGSNNQRVAHGGLILYTAYRSLEKNSPKQKPRL